MTRRKSEDAKAKQRAEYRSDTKHVHIHVGSFVSRQNALYDPQRDGPLRYADMSAEVFGDPPIGRRAIDQRERG